MNKFLFYIFLVIFIDKAIAGFNSTVCPDKSSCDAGETCCPQAVGFACCPFENGVCCSDMQHCCPENMICDLKNAKCLPRKIVNDKKKLNPCLNKGEVVCDGFCCPERTKCLNQTMQCEKVSFETFSMYTHSSQPVSEIRDIKCNSRSSCKDNETCCKKPSAGYSCCPYSQGNCCPSGKSCCPNRYSCDEKERICIPNAIISNGYKFKAIVKSSKLSKTKKLEKYSGDCTFDICADKETCCQFGLTIGCCPYDKGICCKDANVCCPEGSICEGAKCQSNNGNNLKQIAYKIRTTNIYEAIKMQIKGRKNKEEDDKYASVKNLEENRPISVCSDDEKECMDHYGNKNCCPFKNGVCCNSGCCPEGSICKNSENFCRYEWLIKTLPMHMFEPIQLPITLKCQGLNVTCPEKNKCCKGNDGFFCCKYRHGVCCPDGKTCCKKGYKCDMEKGRCIRETYLDDIRQNGHPYLYPKTEAQRIIAVDNGEKKLCPDGKTKCYGMCCVDAHRKYNCCRFKDGVCCQDGRHCCPKGSKCDTKRRRCIHPRENFFQLFNIYDVKNNYYFFNHDQKNPQSSSFTMRKSRFVVPKEYCSGQGCQESQACCHNLGTSKVQCCDP